MAGLSSPKTDAAKPSVDAAKKKPVPADIVSAQPEAIQTEYVNPEALRAAAADPGNMTSAEFRQAQRAYGNQFVQRLANGTSVSGTRASGAARVVRRSGAGEAAVNPRVENRIEASRGRGQPLPRDTRAQMEDSFGADFGGVNVHTGQESDELNRSLNARAFTTGQDIYFAENEYDPHSGQGQELIAHELTHVVQQGGAPPKTAQARHVQKDGAPAEAAELDDLSLSPVQTKMTVNTPGDEYEQEADAMAADVMSQPRAQRETQPGPVALPLDQEQLASLPVSGLQAMPLQRAEDEPTEEESQAKADEALKGGEKKAEEKKDKGKEDKDAKQKKSEEKKEDKKEADKKKEEVTEEVEPVAESLPPQSAAKDIVVPDETFDEEEQEKAALIGQQVAEGGAWENAKPPDWDQEAAMQDAFVGAATGDTTGLQTKLQPFAAVQRSYPHVQRAPASIQRAAAAKSGDDMVWTRGESDPPNSPGEPQPFYEIKVPQADTGSPFGDLVANYFVNGTAGSAINAVNAIGRLGEENNPFGVLATLLEAVVAVMELVTNILTYVILILGIFAAITAAIGGIMIALSFLPFMGGLFAPGQALVNFAWQVVILSWIQTIANIMTQITEVRFWLRLNILIFRALDLLWNHAIGASAETMRRKGMLMADQAMGAATDGISLAGGKMVKAKGWEGATKHAATVGSAAVGAGAGYGIGLANVEANKAAGETSSTKIQKAPADAAPDELPVEIGDAADVGSPMEDESSLTPPPEDVPQRVDDAAHMYGYLTEEKLVLQQRIAKDEALIAQKEGWQSDMTAMEQVNQQNLQVMDEQNRQMDEQQEAATQFGEKSAVAEKQGQETKAKSSQAEGGMKSQESNIDTGMSGGGGGGKEGDQKAAQAGGAKATNTSDDSAALGKEGIGEAAKSKKETAAVQDKTAKATGKVEEHQAVLAQDKAENIDELQFLKEDREACLARLAAIEGEQATLEAEHTQAVAEGETWSQQHKAEREEQGGPAANVGEDMEMEGAAA